jgi:phosphoribosylformylglycinamidine synthase
MERIPINKKSSDISHELSVMDVLDRVLRLVSVGSKRFLTSKVDRSVSGLIAQQQCAGPLHLTVSNVAVISQSHLGKTGAATSIGEQPIKGLLNPAAMARMSVGEALTNIVWAKVSALEDIKCSGNWMWAAKLSGEGARLHDAAVAMSDFMIKLGIAVDGGKDSLSMAAQVTDPSGNTETVKSPGALVISAYSTVPDITKVITPNIKRPGESRLLFIDLGYGDHRIGGSAFAQVYGQLASEAPDSNPVPLKRAFKAVQSFIDDGLILSGHDRSDGGLITTLLEMAFSGNCGIDIELGVKVSELQADNRTILATLFSEELGLAIEYLPEDEGKITSVLNEKELPFSIIGKTSKEKQVLIKFAGKDVLNEEMRKLREIWEETSYQLDRIQTSPACADEERKAIFDRTGPDYKLSFIPEETPADILVRKDKYKVAIIREEGSNSDREMTAAFYQAGFEPWDITMTDLLEEKVKLSDFRGMAFVGGFSYADVLDSAKGWAGVIRFNEKVWQEFQNFYNRKDTFSLGICNGCQLMALLGWVPWQGIDNDIQPRFIHNTSGRFESRFASVKIQPGNAVMLQGMENSVLGVWVAHGEGRAFFPDEEMMKKVDNEGLAPLRYVDDANKTTMTYPFNPNGSSLGIAGLCSPDGRHLAMMPHPERTFLKWHWPWMPEEWHTELKASPWLRMFQNARIWCENN